MRLLSWILRALVFVVLLGFALSNSETMAELRLLDVVWRAPLVLFLFVFFAAGALLGALSAVPAILRQRREIARLRRELRDATTSDLPIDPSAPPPLL